MLFSVLGGKVDSSVNFQSPDDEKENVEVFFGSEIN